jgi:hypothetical protein
VIKKFIKDNRGQVLYAVIVTVMFVGLISMTTMGLTLRNYNAAVQKQQHVSDYYAADAVAELIRVGKINAAGSTVINAATYDSVANPDGAPLNSIFVTREADGIYIITCGTVTIKATIDVANQQFKSWEVSYHAAQTE